MDANADQYVVGILNLSCGFIDHSSGKRQHVKISLVQSITLLEKAIELISSGECLKWQEEKLRKRVASLYFISGQYDKSILHYGTIHNKRIISSLSTGLASDIALISLCLAAKEKHVEAIQHCEYLLKNSPEGTAIEDLALANFVLGFACEKIDKSNDATVAYRKSADLLLQCGHDVCAAFVLNNLGSVLVQLGMFSEALRPLYKSINLCTNNMASPLTHTDIETDPLSPGHGHYFCILKSLRVLAECCIRLQRFSDASNLLTVAVSISRAAPLYSQYGSAVFSVAAAKSLLLEKRYMDAARYANYAVDALLKKHEIAADDFSLSDHQENNDDTGEGRSIGQDTATEVSVSSPRSWQPITMEDIRKGVPPYTYNVRIRHRVDGENSCARSSNGERLGAVKSSALYGLEKSAFMYLQVATAALGSCFESLLVCERWKEVQFEYSLARHSQGNISTCNIATARTSEDSLTHCDSLQGSLVCSPCDMRSRLRKRLSGLRCPALVYHVLAMDCVDNQVLAYLYLPPAFVESKGEKIRVAARLMCKNISFHHNEQRIHNVGGWVSECRTQLNMSGLEWENTDKMSNSLVTPGAILHNLMLELLRLIMLVLVIVSTVAQNGFECLVGLLHLSVTRLVSTHYFFQVLFEWLYLLSSPLWSSWHDTRDCSRSFHVAYTKESSPSRQRRSPWPSHTYLFAESEQFPPAHAHDIFGDGIEIDKEEAVIFTEEEILRGESAYSAEAPPLTNSSIRGRGVIWRVFSALVLLILECILRVVTLFAVGDSSGWLKLKIDLGDVLQAYWSMVAGKSRAAYASTKFLRRFHPISSLGYAAFKSMEIGLLFAYELTFSNLLQRIAVCRDMHKCLVEPFAVQLKTLPPAQHMIVIVDDSLQFLPFGAMMDDEGLYLAERFTLIHMLHFVPIRSPLPPTMPSTSDTTQSGRDSVSRGSAQGRGIRRMWEQTLWERPVFVGKGSLRHAGEEIQNINDLIHKRGISFVAAGLTVQKSDVVNFFRKCSLIHFATHGVFASFQIDGKRVETADFFSVRDVFDMYRTSGRLRPELVVLNTCTTCSDSGNAAAAMGMATSLISCGVNTVVYSVSDVDDLCAMTISSCFYRELLKAYADMETYQLGQTAAAQQEWLRNEECSRGKDENCRDDEDKQFHCTLIIDSLRHAMIRQIYDENNFIRPDRWAGYVACHS